MKKKNIYSIIFIFIIIVFLSFLFSRTAKSINTTSEGWMIEPNANDTNPYDSCWSCYAGKDVTSPGIKKNVRRAYGANFGYAFIPTRTDAELNSFCSYAGNVNAFCNDCGYSAWENYECLSNNTWRQRRTSNWCKPEYLNTSNYCVYCSDGSTCETYSAYSECVVWIDSNNCAALPSCPSGYSCDGNGGCNSCAFLRAVCRAHCVVSCPSNNACP